MSEFDPDKYLEEEFNPDEYLADDSAELPAAAPMAAASPEQALEVSPLEQAFLSVMDATPAPVAEALQTGADFAESLGAGVPVLGPIAAEAGAGMAGSTPEQEAATREASSPAASLVGEMAGTIGGFGLAPQAFLPQMGLSAADMAARGASGGKMAQDLTIEGLLGGAGAAAGKLVRGAGKMLDPEKLKKIAGKRAEAAAGLGATKSLRDKIAKMESTGTIEEGELGQRLLDAGVVRFGESTAQLAERAKELKELAGKEIGQILNDKAVFTKTAQDALAGKLEGTALSEIAQKTQKKIQTQIDLLEEAGEAVDLKDLNKIKSDIGKEIKDFTSDLPTKEGGRKVYTALKEAIEDGLAETELTRLREANKKFQAGTMAGDAALSQSNKPVGELSKSALLYGASTRQPAILASLAGRHLWNKYGNTFVAAGLNKKSVQAMGKHAARLAEAAEKGPSAVAALHFTLMQDDEKYRKKNTKEED